MSVSQSTELQIFNGGLVLERAAHLVGKDSARYLANTNIRRGNLTPFQTHEHKEDTELRFMFFFDKRWHYYDEYRSNVVYNNVWYWTSAKDMGKVYEDGRELPLGIAPPADRLVATIAADPGDGIGLVGRYTYVYTYYDPISTSESPPSQQSNEVYIEDPDLPLPIDVTGFIDSPDGLQIRLYRIGSSFTAYTTVDTFDYIATYTDNKSYVEVQGMILDTLRAYPPFEGLQLLTEYQGRFYGVIDALVYFSAPGKPDSWYGLDFIGFDDAIYGLAATSNGLLVMTTSKTWLLTGTPPFHMTKHVISEALGCISPLSIATQDGTAIWLSHNGFLISDGGGVQNLSINKLGRFNKMDPISAAFLDSRYYLSFDTTLYPSNALYPAENLLPARAVASSGVLSIPRGLIIIDMYSGDPAFSTVEDKQIQQLYVAEGELYSMVQNAAEQANLTTEDGAFNLVTEDHTFNLIGYTIENPARTMPFKGEALRNLVYLSPLLAEGSIGTLKQYEKIRVVFLGIVLVTILDENTNIMQSVELRSVRKETQWINIPVTFNRAYGIQFRVEGQGIVDSLMYTWAPKEIV